MIKQQERTDQSTWRTCDHGEIVDLANNDSIGRRRKFLLQLGSVAGGMTLATLAGWSLYDLVLADQGRVYGGISCRRVKKLSTVYLAGTLNPQIRESISRHLEQCPTCRAILVTLKASESENNANSSTRSVLLRRNRKN